jgi:broad specificity phosphatase PhoE
MKRVYFVRHGLTLKNSQNVHQGHTEPLTEVGKQQAKAVALTLKTYGVDTLITSPLTRAVETATIIGEELGLPFTQTDSVKEFERPLGLYERSHFSPATLKYMAALFWHREDPRWDNDGAENMFHIRNRILDTKRFVCGLEGERIAIISHAIYIDMFVQAVCADRSLGLWEFTLGMLGAKKLPNTGIVAFDIDDNAPAETCNWWLVPEETDPTYLRYR